MNVRRANSNNLGATGLRGWIYTKPANFFESCQGRTTTVSRQILVTHVGEKSPADGVMKVDDVILGAGGKLFTDDARKSIAVAIQEAEKETSGGILKLTRWRAGNPEYLPRVREFARKMAPKTLKLELRDAMVTWEWGYRNLFLCEYYLLTNDKEVLHAINQYTITLAKGQSMYGTFGHGVAERNPDGTLHGPIPPYGPVNATGLIANLAIVMGKKCGVEHPEVGAAIDRGAKFFSALARRHGDLYFASLLPENRIIEAFGNARWFWQGWIYTPAVTIWVFLSQCLSADHSCRDAVARLIAWRLARGQGPCSADTGAHCTAREDLPEEACYQLVRETGRAVDEEAPSAWRLMMRDMGLDTSPRRV